MMGSSAMPLQQHERLLPAVSNLIVVPPPTAPIYRVAHGPYPFEPRPWDQAHVDGTFGNRFDDPTGSPDPLGVRRVLTSDMRFRTLYCSTSPVGAFGETIARFRTSRNSGLSCKRSTTMTPPIPR
jgi:hypothetical protein